MENLLSHPSSVKLVETNPEQYFPHNFFKGIVGVGWWWGQGNGKMIEGEIRRIKKGKKENEEEVKGG